MKITFNYTRERQKGKKGLLKKWGLKVLWNRILSLIIKIASGGNVVLSEAGSIAVMFGKKGVKMILNFRWQAKSLKKAAKRYRNFSKNAEKFLELYDYMLSDDFLR